MSDHYDYLIQIWQDGRWKTIHSEPTERDADIAISSYRLYDRNRYRVVHKNDL